MILVIVGLTIFVPCAVLGQNYTSSNTENERSGCNLQCNGPLALTVTTDKITYATGDPVIISGTVANQHGSPVNTTISIIIKTVPENKTVYRQSVYSMNGTYSDNGFNLEMGDRYNVTASILPNGTTQSFIIFNAKEYYYTDAAIMMYIGITSFAVLMIVIAQESKIRPSLRELFRFILITIIAMAPIAALVLTNTEIGHNAPVGLVSKQIGFNGSNLQWNWVINIGGLPNSFMGGTQIPVFVVVFGLAGGYIRYLYTTFVERKASTNLAQKVEKMHEQQAVKDKSDDVIRNQIDRKLHHEEASLEAFYRALGDLAFLFLSPLLAVATYFLLVQAGENALPTIAAVSFAVGLVTKQIVERLEGFAVGKITGKKDEKKSTI